MTRQEALNAGLVRYDSDCKCPKGHLGERFVSNYCCCECSFASAYRYKQEMDPVVKAAKLSAQREQKRAIAAQKREREAPLKELERQRIKQVQAEYGLDLPTSREEARLAGSEYYFNGKPCPKGHITKRSTKWTGCEICVAEASRAHMKRFRDKNPEKAKAIRKAEYVKHADRYKANAKKYAEDNKELVLAKKKQYQKDHPEVYRHNGAKRRAAQRHACPKWLTPEQTAEIKSLYKQASRTTDSKGNKLHVDHIVPLRGKMVSGLHVPWNLRLMTKRENFRKGPKFDPFLGLAVPLPLGCGAELGSYQL